MTKYTWIITRGDIVGDSSHAVGRVGPPGASNRAPFDVVIQQGRHFRLLNPDGDVVFSGYIVGEYRGPEPLEDFGRESGCSDIIYQGESAWNQFHEPRRRRVIA